ncbi:TonB-dependent receptor [Hymenobacter weizhouensis]|uniref:TonB-dependent receptor n=1 Tax=Hymenobacter sp. YIM 151500-1 TaxID=2987689 RepID=UPI002227D989|nr:TonB-dependent receptor [Hymenobacter sp. YIM 151500-1]UYZ61935.1 TonB-dependent receptor [Hymenobacter sp. YIM 151500-1]
MLFSSPGLLRRAVQRGLWLSLLWTVAGPVVAQSSPAECALLLSGRVQDHESRQVLAGATVVVLETQQATQTEADGHYHLDLCPGTYRVQVTFVGYAPETVEVRVAGTVIRDFRLHPDAVALKSAVVQGQRVMLPSAQATATLSGEALQQTRGQSLGEALRKVTGVTAIQTGPSIFKPMVHGLHSNRLTLLNNGVRQEGQQWGQDHGPELDPFLASQLTVVKGASAVRYGSDALGGVVLVQPPPLRDTAGVGGEAHLVGMSNNGLGAASARLDGNLRRLPALSWRAQGTVRRAATARTPEYNIANSAFAEYNYSGALGWRKPTYGVEAFFSQYNTRIGLFPVPDGSLEDIQRAAGLRRPLVTSEFSYDIERPYQQVRHDLLKLTGFVRTGAAGRLTATVARQVDFRSEFDKYGQRNDERAARNLPELDYRNRTTTADVAWEHRTWRGLTGSIGLSGTYQSNTYRPGSRFFIPYYTNLVGGVYWLESWQHGRWQLEGGLRLDRRDLTTKRPERVAGEFAVREERFRFTTPAASLGAIWDPGAHLTLRADASLTRRAPAANERASRGVHNGIYEEGYDISRPAGARGLTPETAWHTALTATWHDNPRLNGELTVYQTLFDGYIYQTIIEPVLTVRGRFPSYRYQQTDASFRGVDATATYQLASRWLLGAKAAVVVERDRTRRDYLILAPADRLEASLRHDVRLPAATRFSGAYAQLSGLGVRRQTRTPEAVAEGLVDYTAAPPGYALLNAELGTTFRLAGHPLDVNLSGTNLLNTTYRDYLNRYRYYLHEMGRNVSVRVRIPLGK